MRKEEWAWERAERESSSDLHVDGEGFLNLDYSLEIRIQNSNIQRSGRSSEQIRLKKKEKTEQGFSWVDFG